MATAGPKRTVGSGKTHGSAQTRRALVEAAVDALREQGFLGASAREIARRAGCSQALVFYHFGSVTGLLLAALDQVSNIRLERYHEAVDRSHTLPELVETASLVFDEDLSEGYVTVLAEMISGANSTPGLGAEVATRLAPWREFAARAIKDPLLGSPLAGLVPAEELAHGIVALYLGLEMLAHLDDDRASALRLFDRARLVASLLDAFGSSSEQEGP